MKKNIKDKKYSFCYETNKRKFPDEISAKLFLARLDKKDWWKQSIKNRDFKISIFLLFKQIN